MGIALTADRTLISDYHSNELIGFGITALQMFSQTGFIKDFFPTYKDKEGNPCTSAL